MKINCTHGYFKFEELKPGEAAFFSKYFGVDLQRHESGYFTFKELLEVPDHSIKGADFMGVEAIKNYAGQPWEVMEQNGLVFDFSQGLLVPVSEITARFSIGQGNYYFFSKGLIQPGSVRADGTRIVGYTAFFLKDSIKFRYSAVTYG